MSLILSVLALAVVVGLITLFAPQIESWNNRVLLSRGKK
jgi:uncharacterized iron-regulated membrane protein